MTKKAVGKTVLYPDLSYKVIEAVFEVHNQLGPGLTEEIYERALIYELKARDIPFEQQKVVQVKYKKENIGVYRLDLVVDDKIILELKAVKTLVDIHKQQRLAYLKASNLRLGILINFGKEKVQFKRIVN